MIHGYKLLERKLPENQRIYAENKDRMVTLYGESSSRGLIHGPAFEAAQVEDDGYVDGYNTSVAIQTLDELVQQDKPWFLALGFVRPHLPFHAPKKYFDLYNPEEIQLTTSPEPPQNGASMGLHASFELRTRHDIPKSGPINKSLSRKILHAYCACVSYVDAQIGRVIASLEKNKVRENTIIVVWGDHGWHLGEYGIWGKATNYEIATRVPLIISTPSMPQKGSPSDSLVELIDIYPTLCDLIDVPLPNHLEGNSLAALLEKPDCHWDGVALTTYGYRNHAIRDGQYRYIRYADLSEELYDHTTDPYEFTNLANDQTMMTTKRRLAAFLPKNETPPKPISKKENKRKKPNLLTD